MSFKSSFSNTFKNFLRPSGYGKHISRAMDDFLNPYYKLKGSAPLKHPIDTLVNVGNFGLNTALPAAFMYEAVKPNRMDLDTLGPFEETFTRGSNLLMGLTAASPTMWAGKSFIGNLLGEIAGLSTLSLLGSTTGKYLDKWSDNEPSIYDLQNKFTMRHRNKAEQLRRDYPDAPEDAIDRQAFIDILQSAPGYQKLFIDS